MVSAYDVFYVIATKGKIKTFEIVRALNKTSKEYKTIFNYVMELSKNGFIQRNNNIKVMHDERSERLFHLISFCVGNNINYNLMFKKSMLIFLEKASKKEFFGINDIKTHSQTFNFYTNLLSKYGFLLIVSRKPLKCKLLRHHFLVELLSFFNKKTEFYTPKRQSFIYEIKKELRRYRKNIKIHYNVIEDLEKKEEIKFIYSSLNLEGNPLTLPETQKLISQEIIPEKHRLSSIQEVTNYKKAVDYMIINARKKLKLNLDLILEYHKITMQNINEAGVLRRQNVVIKLNPEFKTADWKEIPLKLNLLLKEYENFKSKDIKEIIKFASYFHNEFQRIHPFIDGNSRTSRLLMLHILRSYNIPILDLPLGYFDLYLGLTKGSKKRDDGSFMYLIEEIILMNLKMINSSF